MSQQETFQVYLGFISASFERHLLGTPVAQDLWPSSTPTTHTSCDLNASVACAPPSSATQEPLAIPTQDLRVAVSQCFFTGAHSR